jgi:hypothetical protein
MKNVFHIHKSKEVSKQVKVTEKIILLVGLEKSGKEAFAQYWFGINILSNKRTDAYNKEYTLMDNKTILLLLNFRKSFDTNDYNFIFVDEWVENTKKVKIIVCINHLFDADIFFEWLQRSLEIYLPNSLRTNINIGLVVTSDNASRKNVQVTSKELRDWFLKKLQDQEYKSHYLKVFLHKNEVGAFTNIEIFQYSSSDGSVQNRNQIDWFLNENIQFTIVSPMNLIQRIKIDVNEEQNYVFLFNKRLDALAKSACENIIANYNFGTEINFTELSNIFHRFYEFIDSVEFGQIDALPMKFLNLLEEKNVTIGVHQKQFVNNWKYHSKTILKNVHFKTHAIECKKGAKIKTSWSDYDEDEDSSIAESVLKLSIEQKDRLLLWFLFMSVDNKIITRNDQHSINIHNNIDGALQLIYVEIVSSISNLIDQKHAFSIFSNFFMCVRAYSIAFITVDVPTDVFIRHIDNKLKQIILDIDNSVEIAISKNAEETLKNVVTQIFIDLESKSKPVRTQITLDFFNKTIIWIDNSQQVFANKKFLSKKFHQWITNNNYTVPVEQTHELLEICRTYSQISKTVEKSVKALKYKPDLRRNELYGAFNKTMSNIFYSFKENITTIIVQKLIQTEINVVDKIITQLDQHLMAGFQANEAGAQNNNLPVRHTIQPYRRLNRLQDTAQDFTKFVESVKFYFEIHYIEIPTKEWRELIAVKKVFDDVQHKMKLNQTRTPSNATNKWGRKFVATKTFLLKSTSSSSSAVPSFINDAIKWIANRASNLRQAFVDTTSSYNHKHSCSYEIESLANDTYFNIATNHINWNAAIIILDLILRKTKNVKPQKPHIEFVSFLEAQGIALNIVDECENVLVQRTGNDDHSFNVIAFQNYIVARIRNLDDIKDVELVRDEALKIVKNYPIY